MPRLTFQEIEDAVRDSMFGTGSTGFCLACGAAREGCEPDARGYECFECGEEAVSGAQDVLMGFCYGQDPVEVSP